MYPLQHTELWEKLEALDLDGDAQLPFSQRLGRDNGWSAEFARRVVEEYKRFLFLAATAGHPVTPSDEVDQAWHLHLVYTRLYWDELCGEILGFPLHHGPTRGGKAEGAKFGDWYARTLESYRLAFGEEPPRDIWPEASVRFGETTHFRRVNTKRVWVVRKPEWVVRLGRAKVQLPLRGLVARLAPVMLLLLMAGCAAPTTLNVLQWNGQEFLGVFWSACAVALSLAVFLKKRDLPPLDAVFPVQPLDAYEVARLKDGGTLAVDVALASLHAQGAIDVTARGEVKATGLNEPTHPFERAILKRVGNGSSVWAIRAGTQNGSHSGPLAGIDKKLREAGLLASDEAQKNVNVAPLAIALTLESIGIVRILMGIVRQRPVGFLVITCGALIGFIIWLAMTNKRRTKRGDLLLEHLNRTYNTTVHPMRSFRLESPYRPASSPPSEQGADTTALYFALAGAAAFPPDIRRAVAPPSSGGSSDGGSGGSGCSGGSSDGGSSDGGGGGGCGGGGCGGCGGG